MVSFTNVILISSFIWGVESYNEKLKTIQECNDKINDFIYFVIDKMMILKIKKY